MLITRDKRISRRVQRTRRYKFETEMQLSGRCIHKCGAIARDQLTSFYRWKPEIVRNVSHQGSQRARPDSLVRGLIHSSSAMCSGVIRLVSDKSHSRYPSRRQQHNRAQHEDDEHDGCRSRYAHAIAKAEMPVEHDDRLRISCPIDATTMLECISSVAARTFRTWQASTASRRKHPHPQDDPPTRAWRASPHPYATFPQQR